MLAGKVSRILAERVLFVLAVATIPGCVRREKSQEVSRDPEPAALASSTGTAGRASDEGSCLGDAHQTIVDSEPRVTVNRNSGKRVTHVGRELTVKGAPLSFDEVVRHPEKYRDQIVKVQGQVVAMCGHRRAWFAVAGSESGIAPLRILTAPAFLVPKDAMGTHAIAEGRVDIKEVSARTASHLSRDHGLPDERKIVLIQATGAQFD